jgi:hypothetical protein
MSDRMTHAALELCDRFFASDFHTPSNLFFDYPVHRPLDFKQKSMTITMYQACIPPLTRALNNLIGILEKGAAHAEAKKIDPAVLINSRLYPDMFALAKQVQIASDVSRRGSASDGRYRNDFR